MARVLRIGTYLGVGYEVIVKEDGKKYISLDEQHLPMLNENGANLALLNDIGEQDPDMVMRKLYATMNKRR